MQTFGKITHVGKYKLADNWYEGMRINDAEAELEALHKSWGTADKDRGPVCPRCGGRGYTRKDENIGCIVCFGTGVEGEPADD